MILVAPTGTKKKTEKKSEKIRMINVLVFVILFIVQISPKKFQILPHV